MSPPLFAVAFHRERHRYECGRPLEIRHSRRHHYVLGDKYNLAARSHGLLAQTQTFSASFCLAAGASIAWGVNGVSGGNSTVGTIVTSSADTARVHSAHQICPHRAQS